MHCLVCHGAHVNQQPELIASVGLFQIHVLSFIFFLSQRSSEPLPNVFAFNPVVVQHVG